MNTALINSLRELLKHAQNGTLSDGVFIGFGPEGYRHDFHVREPEDIPRMIGEVSLLLNSLSNIVLRGRAEQQELPKAKMQGGAQVLSTHR